VWNLDLTGHFDSISHYVNERGLPVLHLHCGGWDSGSRSDVIGTLLDLGARIDVRDDLGRTCLQQILYNLRPILHGSDEATRDYDILKLLIERGADINVRDGYGLSPSQLAYMMDGMTILCDRGARVEYYPQKKWFLSYPGSYTGDLWDSVIQSFGHNLTAHRNREGIPRKARYTAIYTRAEFEMLWEGKEDLCPYWDDRPWPPWLDNDSNAKDVDEESRQGSYDSTSESSELDDVDDGGSIEMETG